MKEKILEIRVLDSRRIAERCDIQLAAGPTPDYGSTAPTKKQPAVVSSGKTDQTRPLTTDPPHGQSVP